MEATADEKTEIRQKNERPNMVGECCERHPDQKLVCSNSNIPSLKFPSVEEPLSISHQVISRKNSEANKSWTQSNLSNDIWQEILCRPPVKSILRFRCVSKSWKSLISNPNFIRLHLHCFKFNCHQPHLLCVQQNRFVEEWVVRCSDTSKITDTLGWQRITNPQTFSKFGSSSNTNDWFLLGSIDGLVMLRRVIFVPGKPMRREYLLWNPSIKKVRSLIIHNMIDVEHEKITDLGLGFDPLIKDYKFFRLVYHSDDARLFLQVYTIGSGLWKTIQLQHRVFLEGHFIWGSCQTICTGSFIYILDTYMKDLVSINMSNEKLASIQIPEYAEDESPTELHDGLLRVDGGCSLLRVNFSAHRVYIWGLGTSGDDSESLCWSKHYSFTVTEDPSRIIYLKENGDVLVEDDEDNNEMVLLNDGRFKTTVNAFEYKESLLWIE